MNDRSSLSITNNGHYSDPQIGSPSFVQLLYSPLSQIGIPSNLSDDRLLVLVSGLGHLAMAFSVASLHVISDSNINSTKSSIFFPKFWFGEKIIIVDRPWVGRIVFASFLILVGHSARIKGKKNASNRQSERTEERNQQHRQTAKAKAEEKKIPTTNRKDKSQKTEPKQPPKRRSNSSGVKRNPNKNCMCLSAKEHKQTTTDPQQNTTTKERTTNSQVDQETNSTYNNMQ